MSQRISQQRLESYLWGAATLLRGTIDAGDYKQFIFPLLFYKRVCDVFDEETQSALKESDGDATFAAYRENHRFQVPPEAHWDRTRQTATGVGHAIQTAMRAIETANPDRLFGIFGDAQWTNRERLSDAMLRDLVDHFSTLKLTVANLPEDELGNGYEFLIKKFADDSGHTAAEFYTNRTVVHLMTEMLKPQPGESIYDPTCGSGGMLLSCIAHLQRQGKEWRNVRLYGQERNLMTSSIARMNCFLHGIEDFRIERGDTLAEPKFVDADRLKRFDVVLANPPYSIKQWDREAFASDPWGRNLYGTPSQGRADYAFWQHILASLAPKTGRCAILFPHGVLFRQEEAEMRRKIVEADLIECVIGLGPNLFYNASMEASVVVCRTTKPRGRTNRVLFINAVKQVTRERAHSFLTDTHIRRIVAAYDASDTEPGFATVATLEAIRKNDYSLKIDLYADVRSPENGNNSESKSAAAEQLSGLSHAVTAWSETRRQLRDTLDALLPDARVSAVNGAALRPVTEAQALQLFDHSAWTRVRFGDVVRCLKESVDPNSGECDRYVAGEHMDSGDVHIRRWGTVGDGYLGPAFIRRFRKGQVLYGSRRTYLKKIAWADFDGITANTTLVLEGVTGRLHQPLLPWIMLSQRFTDHSVRESKGSTNPYINYPDIAKFEFDLPPLDHQHEIADLLWATARTLDAYEALRSEIEEARVVALAGRIQAVSVGARECRLSELALPGEDSLKTGPFGSKLNARCFASSGIPVINIAAIGDEQVETGGLMFLKPALSDEFRSYFVRSGDIVFSRVADIGRCMTIGQDHAGSMISSNLIRIRVDAELVAPEYLLLLLRYSTDVRRQIRSLTSSGGRALVNTTTLAELVFAVPTRDRQDQVLESSRDFRLALESIRTSMRAVTAVARELSACLT